MRRAFWAPVVLIMLAACGGDDGSGPNGNPSNVTVSMTDNAFSPVNASVAVNGTVTWRNNGAVQHNTTGANNAWASTNLNPNGTFSRQFTSAGTFNYSCTLHPGMNGTITVQ